MQEIEPYIMLLIFHYTLSIGKLKKLYKITRASLYWNFQKVSDRLGFFSYNFTFF